MRGLRVVNMTDGTPTFEIEKRTGCDLDEWITVLDNANASTLTHAEIMAFIRGYGVEFPWQKTVTVAYERALGRHSVGQTSAGTKQVVAQETHSDFADWVTRWTKQRFNIRKMMLGTFCMACLLGFARVFDAFRPPAENLKYGIPITIGVAIIALPALCGCLGVRGVRRKLAILPFVAIAVASYMLYAMGINSSHPNSPFSLIAELGYVGLLTASLMLVRNPGYRLVRVQPMAISMKYGVPQHLGAQRKEVPKLA